MKLDKAKPKESLNSWCKRNGIDLGDKSPEIIGYWCRASGVSVDDEAIRRRFDRFDSKNARQGWKEADDEIRAEEVTRQPESNAKVSP